MPDSFDAHEIARKSFESGRKGYEPQEVRAYLHEISSHVERLQREQRDLRERADRAEARLGLSEKPDDAMLLEVLGEETTRVLTSAREAAAEIRAKAEAAAERIVSDATTEAAETRSSAMQEADRKRAEAASESEALLLQARTELERRSAEADVAAAHIRDEATATAQATRDEGAAELARAAVDAAAIREAARDEGRSMVAEAQAVRERVLRDLATRRKKARQQVEKLNAGRERLLEAYDVVRSTVDEATTELHQSLSDARLAADAAARRVEEEDDLSIEELDAEVATAGLVELLPSPDPVDSDADPAVPPADEDDDSPSPLSGEVPAITDDVESGGVVDADEPVDLDERRSRKRRRKSEFAGVDTDSLAKVEPPSTPEEGIRILAEPATAPEPDEPEAIAADEPTADEPTADEPTADEPTADESMPEPDPTPEPVAEVVAPPEPEPEPEPVAEDAPEPQPVPEFAGVEPTTGEATAADAGAAPTVGELFARLRSETVVPEADSAESADEPTLVEVEAELEVDVVEAEVVEVAHEEPEPAESSPFRTRDDELGPIDRELAKRLKRALADEQNEVLDRLRRAKPQGVDDLLPTADDHAGRWAETALESLAAAAKAGAGGAKAKAPTDLAEELARSLTGPLRDRIDRSFEAADGNLDEVTDRVRALYREWKGQRLQETGTHFLTAAYARGLLDALDSGASVKWVLDPDHPACPDCSDNVLAGTVTKGDEFPTGQTNAPAHPGCRCLVLAADD